MTQPVHYVTTNAHKREEIRILEQEALFQDGRMVRDVFSLSLRTLSIHERLEIDLELMVRDEALRAYEKLKVPCVVEHAGLVFDEFVTVGYPGGLTKPMWNALGDAFCRETMASNRKAIAKAVVAYCDGMNVHTFTGLTTGHLTGEARGSRSFYWDTVFVPDDPKRPGSTLTYAEIVADEMLGLRYKVLELSQSTRAMLKCLQFIRDTPRNRLWA